MKSMPFFRTLLVCAVLSSPAVAGELTIPHTFVAGQPAVAAQVNQNFASVKTEVDAKDARIAALEVQVAALLVRLEAIENSNLMALEPHVSLEHVPDPNTASLVYPTVRFTGVNVQVVDGSDDTASATNGLGNLIVGYNETDGMAPQFCSLPGYIADSEGCTGAGGIWARNQRSGSHNLVLGWGNAYTSYAGRVAGRHNVISGIHATVGGGHTNRAIGDYAVVGGGELNIASGLYAIVSGGHNNIASGQGAWVGSGIVNKAEGLNVSIIGGAGNRATGNYAAVSGGMGNFAEGYAASISGGASNKASDIAASVSGGYQRSATGVYNWRAGGLFQDQ
ncbi:hypothetical protein [Pseudofulvimonas gallinarii]|nr:hypothetical protein [Pseudofulvimonas gallinarii]